MYRDEVMMYGHIQDIEKQVWVWKRYVWFGFVGKSTVSWLRRDVFCASFFAFFQQRLIRCYSHDRQTDNTLLYIYLFTVCKQILVPGFRL